MSGAVALASPQLRGFRLSPQQERLWALLPAGTGPYRSLCALALAGRLDLPALTGALRALVDRHEILRSDFQRLPGMLLPVQVVAPAAEPALATVDLSALPPTTRQREWESLWAELEHLPFDSGCDPRLCLVLARLGPEDHRLLMALPALRGDAAALSGMAREIARLYAAGLAGAELAEAPLQYGDAAEFLHSLFEEPESEPGRAYWRGLDLDALSALELPCPGAPAPAFTPRRMPLDLGGSPAGLEGLAAAAGVGLPEALFGLFLIAIARLAPRLEAAASLLCAGRKYEEVAELPGLFARGLPVSLRLTPDEPVAATLRRVAATVERVHRLQDFFRWRPAGDAAVPFLRFAFELADEEPAWCAGGLSFRCERLEACVERFGVKLSCRRHAGALSAEILYDAAALPRREVERFGLHLSALAAGAVADPDAAVDDLPLLSAAERHRVVREWNDTAVRFGRPELVHGLFEEQAARTPCGVAVESEERCLTYADLEAEANRWAWLLRRRGVGPEVRVGICLDRSADLVVALLAVLKAGGAWVPLEPDLPPARLAALLEDARPALLLTAGALPAAAEGLPRLDLRADRAVASGESPARLEAGVAGESLAYALFTSGSSGRPKGVMVSHRAICNRLAWMLAEFPLAARDAVLQKTPLGFDACIWEFFVPLASGARLVLARPGGHRDMDYLARAVAAHGITVLQLVPSVLRLFLDEPGAVERAAGLRLLFCGGEALPVKLRQRVREALLRTELHNLYGPTEAAIDATFEPRADGAARVSIGRPLANVHVLLLGLDGAPVPEGSPGELHIGGAGLARGYLGRPELTAERFVPDPWSGDPGGRLYRTGDLARHLVDGAIEFLGRFDLQVKVRGVRIELGEVEAAVAAHPRVRQAAVAALPDAKGDSRLTAYLVIDGAGELGLAELRGALASHLPEAMMPAAVVLLKALPLLPNGKVDRAALPAPEAAVKPEAAALPRTPVESLIARVWAEVLGVESIGLHQSFFDLGGNSLSATQVFSRLRKALAVDLPLRSLFEVPTVAGFAARVESACRQEQGVDAPPIAPVSRGGPLPLSFAQQRLWFLEQWAPGRSLFHIANALRVRGRLDVAILGRSLAEVVRRHDSLRTTFSESGGEPLQVVHPPGPPGAAWSLPVIDLAGLPAALRETEALTMIARESRRPFDLQRGPLLRALVARASERESLLLVAMHHIVSDAWSIGILVREVLALYRAFAEGLPSPLPPPACQYPDFAVWQREWLRGDVLAGHLAFWRRHLEGAPPLLRLPSDLPGDGEAYVGGRRAWRLDRNRSGLLAALARREGVTLFVVLLAAFQVLLHRLTGQEDLVVGSDVANRNRIETEEILGFFVNQLALRGDLAGNPSFRELMARVRGVVLESYMHQDLPFDRLVEALNPDRRLNPAPLFQIKMNLHNVPRFPLALPGLELEPLEVPREVAQLDLILNLVEGEDGLEGNLEYSASRFSTQAMDRLLAQLTDILGAVVANPELRLSELGRVLDRSEAERQRARERELAEARRRTFQAARRRTVEVT
ncbi:MAG TPA: amino acid adenylation domain-containing protein [Thermoanaerobaculia bacterium]|jgi:amino acid adenylation domain-containing protein|nr:amino acid adenylation domain-containing protein [Thermoanaerobaculia bacterium]